jgi:putative sterol carrier protein
MLATTLRGLRARRCERLAWMSPPRRLRTLAAALGFLASPRDELHGWVGMFKVIRLPQLLREIAPLLVRRLAQSPSAGWEGALALSGSRLRATLEIAGDQVRVRAGAARDADVLVTISDDDITSLVVGDCDIWDAYRHHRLSTRPAFNERIWRLVEALFPPMDVRQGWPNFMW